MTRVSPSTEKSQELYVPRPAAVELAEQISATERLLTLRPLDDRPLGHSPGQFVQVNLFGVGEAPISVCSAQDGDKPEFQLCVRGIGRLTRALHGLKPGEEVGIRGPYGRGFRTEAMSGQDVLFIAGGIGLAPLRSLVQHCLASAERFGRLTLLYGARSPAELLFEADRKSWAERGLDVRLTVDRAVGDWKGHVGVITTLLEPFELHPEHTVAAVCGPPVMYRFVIRVLEAKRLTDERIQLSLERQMRCGVGKCGHCVIGDYYCCIDGPVFTYDQIRNIPGAL